MKSSYSIEYFAGDYEIVSCLQKHEGDGFTFEEAKQWVIEDLEIRKRYWENITEDTYFYKGS